ncbi:MAG TPA: BTAD domain-containing putative transcriptional regulator [Chloroflexota bacterium]|nr:BTAD domain-containing putative transcriptional regulator [Chloroflexota bacterium]
MPADDALLSSSPSSASAVPSDGIYATFFGTFAVHRCGTRLELGRSKPAGELGRYLLARSGRPVAREELVELLWPESDPGRAMHRLHVAVSSLRRVLDFPQSTESIVRHVDGTYAIASGAVQTDCDHFEGHFRCGRALLDQHDWKGASTAFAAAIELYAGDYLAEYPYADWTQRYREHFAERRINALLLLCEHALRQRDFVSVLEHAHRILEADRLCEPAHRYLMRAYYWLGQRAPAVRQYGACVNALRAELNVAPSELTQSLFRAVCDDTPLPEEVLVEHLAA